MDGYIIQVDNKGIPINDMAFQVIESIRYTNWYNPKECIKYILSTIQDLNKITFIELGIPVGSLEFVAKVMELSGYKKDINHIIVPDRLRTPLFLQREISFGDKNQIQRILQTTDEVFVKEAIKIKGCTGIITNRTINQLEEGTLYFISSIIDIKSEWRVFVYKDQIMDIRLYSGDWYDQFDADFIRLAVSSYTNSPPAYTLDIAKLSNGKSAVIEAHNFIACGLYGFENHRVLRQMIARSYNWEIANK